MKGPLVTFKVHAQLRAAADKRLSYVDCSLDLDRTEQTVVVEPEAWIWNHQRFPYLDRCKQRTVYYWAKDSFQPIARFTHALIKLVPTEWGAPTFEIDGIKMLPTARISPYADAEQKVGLIQPHGKVILDTCGGLGYFAAWCLQSQATHVLSYEKNADVIWLRSLNPWSPDTGPQLTLTQGDITTHIPRVPDGSIDAVLHDPPRFGIAGELYAQEFYNQLLRVLRPGGRLFHYTGTPNKLTSGRDVPNEVLQRLRRAGFSGQLHGDGVLAVKP